MNNLEHMAEQHILEYESRLKHVDEMVDRVRAAGHPDAHEALQSLLPKRDELAGNVEQMRLKSLKDWRQEEIQKAGPMGIWDALAQQLEDLVERFER